MIKRAYAKINLTLDITGKREDGYHSIESVMQAIDLYDEVDVQPNDSGSIQVATNRRYLPLDEKNTAYRAAKHFFAHTGIQAGVTIFLDKHIPGRAGLGGGSADAAAVLYALDEIFETALPTHTLLEIGKLVGADVPFCLMGGTCLCTGIGETLTPLPPMPDCTILLCKPPAGMSTPRAYALVDQYPMPQTQNTPRMCAALENKNLKSVAAAMGNRFDEVLRMRPVREIERIMKEAGALNAVMTGSGSAVYGLFTKPALAQRCLHTLQDHGQTFLCSPRPLSPNANDEVLA